ncbi:MAG: GNAT family N-acetyltransferase [Pseudomonadota bacterium]
MTLRVFVAGPEDAAVFAGPAAEDVFDGPCPPDRVKAYLADPRLHMVLATEDDRLVGMCSGVHYFHPDKPNEMFINELGVAPTHRRRGIATQLVHAMCDLARGLECQAAWVISDPTDTALGFYRSLNVRQDGEHLAMFTIDL